MTNENQEPVPVVSAGTMMISKPEIPQGFFLQRAPEIVLEEARRAARALAEVIAKKPKKVIFGGETYPEYEDWQTIGRFYNITAGTISTKYIEIGVTRGYEATAEAISTQSEKRVSSAEAMCMSDEANWRGKPLFQLRSMAQTRACAKALRNALGWVVVLGGLAPTPAEEMKDQRAIEEPEPRQKRGRPRQEPLEGMTELDPRELKVILEDIAARDDKPSLTSYCNDIYKTKYGRANEQQRKQIKAATESQVAKINERLEQELKEHGEPGVFAG